MARPCALDSDGVVTCWVSDTWAENLYFDHWTFVEKAVTGEHISGAHCPPLVSHTPGEVPTIEYCDNAQAPCCAPPTKPMQEVYGTFGITLNDELANLLDSDDRHIGQGRGWHALTQSGFALGAVDRNNVLGIVDWEFTEIPLPHDRPILYTTLHFFGSDTDRGGCVLDTSGIITCVGTSSFPGYEFTDGPYRFLDGMTGYICAIRTADDLVECNDGTLHDLGWIHDLAVYPYPHPDEDDVPILNQVSMCAITTDNEIRCSGPHYPPDLLQTLADLPR